MKSIIPFEWNKKKPKTKQKFFFCISSCHFNSFYFAAVWRVVWLRKLWDTNILQDMSCMQMFQLLLAAWHSNVDLLCRSDSFHACSGSGISTPRDRDTLGGLIKGVTKSFFMNKDEWKLSMLLGWISYFIMNYKTEPHGMLSSKVFYCYRVLFHMDSQIQLVKSLEGLRVWFCDEF